MSHSIAYESKFCPIYATAAVADPQELGSSKLEIKDPITNDRRQLWRSAYMLKF